MKRSRKNHKRRQRHSGVGIHLEGLESRMMLNGGGFPDIGSELGADIVADVEIQTVPDVVYIGDHADSVGSIYQWTDTDGDEVQADFWQFNGQGSYVGLEFDRLTGELREIDVHAPSGESNKLGLNVWQEEGGDGRVQVGSVVGDSSVRLESLDLTYVELVGSGVDIDGSVETLLLGDVADGIDVELGSAETIAVFSLAGGEIGAFRGDLKIDGDLGEFAAVFYDVDGTIDVQGDVGVIATLGSSLSGSLYVGGDLGEVDVDMGDIDAQVTVDGQVGMIKATSGPTGVGGNISGTFNLAHGADLIHADGGNIDLDGLSVDDQNVYTQADGKVHLLAEAHTLDGVTTGGSVCIAGSSNVYGSLRIEAKGGNVELSSMTVMYGSGVIKATAHKGRADSGNITAENLVLIGSPAHHVIRARGGDVDLANLTVIRTHKNISPRLSILASESYVAGAYQGGDVRLGKGWISATTSIWAFGGNIELGGKVDVYGDVSRLIATKSHKSAEPSGAIVSVKTNKWRRSPLGTLRIHGKLRYMNVDRLATLVDADSLGMARIRGQKVKDQAAYSKTEGWLRSRDFSGYVYSLNGWTMMNSTVDGLVHALSA